VTATTAVEQLVACGIMLLGIIFFGFVISTSQCAAPCMRYSVHAAAKLVHALMNQAGGSYGLRHACLVAWRAVRCSRTYCAGSKLGRCTSAGAAV